MVLVESKRETRSQPALISNEWGRGSPKKTKSTRGLLLGVPVEPPSKMAAGWD